MQSNSELANSWNIKQNSEENPETDDEDCLNDISKETCTSNKSLTKYDNLTFRLFDLFLTFFSYDLFSLS